MPHQKKMDKESPFHWRKMAEDGIMSDLWLMDRDDPRPVKDFHGASILQFNEAVIRRWGFPDCWMWDMFAGSGTSAYAADNLGVNVFLSDLNPLQDPWVGDHFIHYGDATRVHIVDCSPRLATGGPYPAYKIVGAEHFETFKFDLVFAHPPYHDIIQFSDKPADLSAQPSPTQFLNLWDKVVCNAMHHLKAGGYFVALVGDIWITADRAKAHGGPAGYYPLTYRCLEGAMKVARVWGHDPMLKAVVVKDIKGNEFKGPGRNLALARYARWGTVEFKKEIAFAIQKRRDG